MLNTTTAEELRDAMVDRIAADRQALGLGFPEEAGERFGRCPGICSPVTSRWRMPTETARSSPCAAWTASISARCRRRGCRRRCSARLTSSLEQEDALR